MIKMRMAGLMMTMIFMTASIAADTSLTTDKQRFSYTIGVQIGDNFLREGLDIDAVIIGQAIEDVLSHASLRLSPEQMQAALKVIQEQKMKERAAIAEKNLVKGQQFLAAYSKEKGALVLGNGLVYKVLSKGTGEKPLAEDTVEVHYRGTLIDGEEFDSSYKRGAPATFGVNAVIVGWQEILPMMPVGAKWQVVIPADMAYGKRGTGGQIGPNETLIFDIELIAIK